MDSDRIPNYETYFNLRSKSKEYFEDKANDKEDEPQQHLEHKTNNTTKPFTPPEGEEPEDKCKDIHKLKETFRQKPKYFCGSDDDEPKKIVNTEENRDDRVQENIKFSSDYEDIKETGKHKELRELKERTPQKTRYFCGTEDDELKEEGKTRKQFDDKTPEHIRLFSDVQDIEHDGMLKEAPVLKDTKPQKLLYSCESEAFENNFQEEKQKQDSTSCVEKNVKKYRNINPPGLWKSDSRSCGRFIGRPVVIYLVVMSLSGNMCTAEIGLALLDKTPQIGKNVTLICSFNQSNATAFVWLKGETNSQLANGGSSKNASKYITDSTTSGDFHQYKLTIKDFGFDDFGKYICEVEFKKKSIYLPKDTFIYLEKENGDEMQIFELKNAINVSVSFEKVYPRPHCGVVFDNNSYTGKLSESVRKYHLYFYFTMFAMLPLETTCHATVRIKCYMYGKNIRDFHKTINRCSDLAGTNYLYLLFVAVILVPIVVTIIMFKYIRKKKDRLSTDTSMNEEKEMMNLSNV